MVGGRTCRCGALGCLEAYVGAEAILDQCGGPLPLGRRGPDAVTLGAATLPIQAFLGGNVFTTREVAQRAS
jgi:predicted NBD/HSP70 family sugar kinase